MKAEPSSPGFPSATGESEKFPDSPYERRRGELIAELVPAGGGRRALDVGCGPGRFARLLVERTWRVDAIDRDANRLGPLRPLVENAWCGDAVEMLAGLPDAAYDFALALELIEHLSVSRGRRLLRQLRRVLKPTGRLLLSTPNRYSLEGLIGYYLNEKLRRARRWEAWDPSHVHIYSSSEILSLLHREGFGAETVIGYWYEARLPLLGRVRLPLSVCRRAPGNRLGFHLIVSCCVR